MCSMSKIIKIDFKSSDGPYYLRVMPDFWQQVYDPMAATDFHSEKSAMDWASKNTTMAEYMTAADRASEFASFEAWAKDGYIRCNHPYVDKLLSRKYNKDTDSKADVLKWRVSARLNECQVKFVDYQTWPQLHEVFKNIHSLNAYSGTDDCLDITLALSIATRDELEEFKEEVLLALPYVTVRNEEYLVLDIFDHFLSEHGNSVRLNVLPDLSKARVVSTYGSEHLSGTLPEAFEYLRKHRWYNKRG